MGRNIETCDCITIHKDVVEKVKKNLKSDELIQNVADFFKAFSDSTRLKIVSMLLEEEMCVCDIANVLNMTHSSVSHQLRVLRQLRVVKNRKDGKTVYYSLDDDHVRTILAQGINHLKH
ncbi:ArsR/SmtB family transcription factor [Ilyobacter polytropus]|uniref:Transcriptional regulator, ArsR family n=1 Tax=Ilyobacter polytropus (strain ATCC 51220 / DSM 2926 / LMG 16218 / CuHBu1) TaxID=572544 RepID=E3HA11_ILYPC|nr:metalloregulator ArsR/SmtB family transcription factor [Ilyobacter polytropus]ADO83139.1 transcriptional regulator, ArsR family [Ilyobacter polytropus DSM 2926]